MRFSAKKFNANASNTIKRLATKPHIQAMDGKEVVNKRIDYMVDGQDYYFYPVQPEWCEE